MTGFLAAAVAMSVAMLPAAVVVAKAEPLSAVVAYELVSSIVIMVLLCVAQGFGRSGEMELAVVLAVLLYGSGLVFVRALERWL